jgi:hypothetical protein
MKSWYITVIDLNSNGRVIFNRKCLNVKDANTLFTTKKEEYPDKIRYMVLKESY